MLNEALKLVLTAVVAAGLTIFFAAIKFEIDPVLFNTLVGAIVVWIMLQLGLETAAHFFPKRFHVK